MLCEDSDVNGESGKNELDRLFHPVVARLFEQTGYRELAPGSALRPWVRCFWGSEVSPGGSRPWLVVPDACTDLILRFPTGQEPTAAYVGLSDTPFWTGEPTSPDEEIFAVRFHFWAAPVFAEDSLRDTLNRGFAAGRHFPALERELRDLVSRHSTLEARARAWESVSSNGSFGRAWVRAPSGSRG